MSHIIKALSHRGSPDAKAQAVQCPQKVRTSPAYSSGVQTPFYKPYHTPPPPPPPPPIKLIRWKTLAHKGSMQPPRPPPPPPSNPPSPPPPCRRPRNILTAWLQLTRWFYSRLLHILTRERSTPCGHFLSQRHARLRPLDWQWLKS